jgi:hypothetical protein
MSGVVIQGGAKHLPGDQGCPARVHRPLAAKLSPLTLDPVEQATILALVVSGSASNQFVKGRLC